MTKEDGKMPAIAERLPAKYLIKDEAPKTISSPQQHEAYLSRLQELQRKAHRTAEETETAKLLIVLIADYEGKHFAIEKASGIEVLKELMDANGLRQKDLAEDLGGEVRELEHGPILARVEGRRQEVEHRVRRQARLQLVHGGHEQVARRTGVGKYFGDLHLAGRQGCRTRRFDQEIIAALGPRGRTLRRSANAQNQHGRQCGAIQ